MHRFGELKAMLEPLTSWMRTEALPFWTETGFDRSVGGFHNVWISLPAPSPTSPAG